jgi:hypothetical protein
MSGLPPKADIRRRDCDVRFVPKADMHRSQDRSAGGRSKFTQVFAPD